MSRGALLLLPYGTAIALLGGRLSNTLATPTLLGVSFAVLFGGTTVVVALSASAPLLTAHRRGRGS